MAVKCGYYNSKNKDRRYNAEEMSQYFMGLISKGVLQNYLEKFVVVENEGMNVIVSPGRAYFSDGKFIENTTDYTIAIDASDVILNRIDRIVLQNNKDEDVRSAAIVYKKGEPATQPTAPELINTADIEELSLATIKVDKLVETITQADITNTIPDTSVCGYVTGLIEQVDTSDLYAQYEAAYSQSLQTGETAFSEQLEEQETEFDTQKTTNQAVFDRQIEDNQAAFDEWYEGLQGIAGIILLAENRQQFTTTAEAGTDTFTITIPNYNASTDITNVFINGIQATPSEFDILNGNTLKLAQPLPAGQVVEVIAMKSTYGADETA